MNETDSIELYRQEGPEFRSVRLSTGADGAIRLDAQDMGGLVKRVWGDDDYEFWVDVPATEINKLVFALLRDRTPVELRRSMNFARFAKKKESTTRREVGSSRVSCSTLV